MSLIQIYECFCNEARLRILNLLAQGPLCVCHLQDVLDEPQVKISKHLGYLRQRGLVEARRQANWMVYSLPARPSRELSANLACLQDCAAEITTYRADLARLERCKAKFADSSPICCPPKSTKGAPAKSCCS